MVKLIQAKYIKQLFIFLVFALLFSYQQNVKADTDRSLTAAMRIMANKNFHPDVIQSADEHDSSYAFGLLSFAVAGDDGSLFNNFIFSENAFAAMLSADDQTYRDSRFAASTVMTVDALSLLASLIDELIAIGDTTSMDIQREEVAGDNADNPIVVQAVGLDQIAAYSELFEGYRSFLRNSIRNAEYDRTRTITRDAISELRGAFESSSDYLSGRALQQTPECSNLFCSLYTLRLENPDVSINDFVTRQIQINEFYDASLLNNMLAPGERGTSLRRRINFIITTQRVINLDLNSLRQSRAATETVLPGNDPNAGQQQQQQQQQQVSEECRMAPSLPGC